MSLSRRMLYTLIPVTIIGLILVIAWPYILGEQQYTVYEDYQPLQVKGQFTTNADVLKAAGVIVGSGDIVVPDIDQPADPKSAISVVHAREVVLNLKSEPMIPKDSNEKEQIRYSQQDNLASFLNGIDVFIRPGDQIFSEGELVYENQIATAPLLGQVDIIRQKELTIWENNQKTTAITSASTVGELLIEKGIRLFAGDSISPTMRSWLMPGSDISIERSIPLSVKVDGQVISTRSQHHNVRSLLFDMGISLTGQDYTIPRDDVSLLANDQVNVVRVREDYSDTEESIPFVSITQPSNKLELDQLAVIQTGAPGILRRSTLIRYENGVEVSRAPAGESVVQQPIDEIVGYGTNIVIRTMETPEGPIEYWRTVRMRVTAYTAATSGKDRSHPAYGITASGVPAGFGVVSVDPNVVPFRSYVYVPGYGKGFAGDTGGGVIGRFIDLGYDEGQIEAWNGYTDVFYLTPVPPLDQINYLLPTTLP